MCLNYLCWNFKMEGDIETRVLFFLPFSCVWKSPSLLSVEKCVPIEVGWPWLFRDIPLGNLFQCVIVILNSASSLVLTLFSTSGHSRKSVSTSISGCGILDTKELGITCRVLAGCPFLLPFHVELMLVDSFSCSALSQPHRIACWAVTHLELERSTKTIPHHPCQWQKRQ